MKHFNRTVTVLVFIFLYIPMIVLAVVLSPWETTSTALIFPPETVTLTLVVPL